ncbi:MAG: YggS family pyridoxal phosphate-dependent enzyme [Deltaproteobacteria bacterium]|jgi:pyridoxal phosphate enzyme (YggS family)|nr:YggS family pyridoxal phosphate-dependent enzyme [Deltaproteobacteria bacterium]
MPCLPEEVARQRLSAVLSEIAESAAAAGRKPEDIALLAVSKTFPKEDVAAYLALGQRDFGENYLQKAQEKVTALPEANWHFIGHLQTNKARFIPGLFSVLHTLDSLELAARLQDRLADRGLTLQVFIQVNVSGEESKSGLNPKDLPAFLDNLTKYPALIPQGLMTIPPYDPDPELSRPFFRKLYELQEKEAQSLKGLSMGMSGDFKVAISEGATVVRIGTALFGARSYS